MIEEQGGKAMKRKTLAGLAVIFLLGHVAAAQISTKVPIFQVDPTWPQLPNNWVLGVTSAVAVDSRDHVWIMHRPRTVALDQKAAPPVLEFDAAGKFVNSWGGPGPGYEWPDSEHGIYVDDKNGVWIGGSSRPGAGVCGVAGNCTRDDSMILKFTPEGKFIMAIGHRDAVEESDLPGLREVDTGFTDTKNVHTATGTFVHNNELFITDGYQGPGPQGNCRVIVFDSNTGAFKRMWGGFGKPPGCNPADPERAVPAAYGGNPAPAGRGAGGGGGAAAGGGGRAAQPTLDTEGDGSPHLGTAHGIGVSNDGLVYVCDRGNRRIQVFTITGKYVTQAFINRGGPSRSSAASLAFSRDPEQKYMYVADYGNSHVVVMDRKSLGVLYQFGDRNARPGDFQGLHNIAIDSKGNLYTAEVEPGRRAQRFVFKGMGTPPTQ
jgi:hypothetical protein